VTDGISAYKDDQAKWVIYTNTQSQGVHIQDCMCSRGCDRSISGYAHLETHDHLHKLHHSAFTLVTPSINSSIHYILALLTLLSKQVHSNFHHGLLILYF
jgi:hypothetical protein